jgi:D-amino-acid dehydrogenase
MSAHRVIVIGSGISGAAAAFAFARRGVAVSIVDSAEPGQATAASAGIISPWTSSSDGPFYDLYAAGGAYYPELMELLAEAGIERTDYRRTGSLVVSADDAKLHEVQARIEARAAKAGPVAGDVQRLGNAETRALFPVLAPDLEAVFISGGGRVDGRTLRDALLSAVAGGGAVSISGRARLLPRAQGTPGVEVDGSLLEADEVVVAAGAWVNALLVSLGTRVDVEPQRGQITHLRAEGTDTSRWPTVSALSDHYLVAFDDSRIAVGATRETGSGFDPRVTADGQRRVLNDALSIAPGLRDATFIETRVGLRPLPSDGQPAIGPLPGHDHLHVLSGFGAAGLTMGPFAGDCLARAILDNEVAAEIAAFVPGSN